MTNLKIVFIILMLLALFLESTWVNFPLILILSLYMVILFKSTRIMLIVFAAGIAIDSLRVVQVGITPLIVLSVALMSQFYSRTLHFADILIFSLAIFVITVIYSSVLGYTLNIIPAVVIFGVLISVLYGVYNKKGIISERVLE